MSRAIVLGGVAAAATVVALAGTAGHYIAQPSTGPPHLKPEPEALATTVTSCGVERAAVKHLTDLSSRSLPAPVPMTIQALTGLTPPAVSSSSPRFPQENTVVELDNVHVIAVKQEPDSDLHIIVATDAGAEMNIESPMAQCDSSSPYAADLARARASADAALPAPSSSAYTPVNLRATIVGVLFWDVLHGQRGAPNGIELHPLLSFAVGGAAPPPISPPPPVAPPPPPAAMDDALDELPGCAKYPGRIYFGHVKQTHCAASFFLTP